MFNHLGSLITYEDKDGNETCLGFLFNFQGHGVFDAEKGKVEITPEQMEIHNQLLSEALIKGLDENCEIGQGGTFYFIDHQVKTFTGVLVSSVITKRGNSLTFFRSGKEYRGRLQKDADCFNFKRVR